MQGGNGSENRRRAGWTLALAVLLFTGAVAQADALRKANRAERTEILRALHRKSSGCGVYPRGYCREFVHHLDSPQLLVGRLRAAIEGRVHVRGAAPTSPASTA
jgi:hypothetical protein